MLAELLPAQVFALLLIFTRMGTALMLMPGFGESYISMRIRLLLALLVSLVIHPAIAPSLPALPASPTGLLLLVFGEAFIGLFLGSVARILMAALSIGGMIIATVTGLANALTNDPTAAQQGSIAGSFLSTLALLIIIVLDLHHLLLRGVIDSYQLFVPGQPLLAGDMSLMISRVVSKAFLLGFQIASPFVAIGLIFNLGLGLLSRLMPQMQVFFIAIPLQILIGLAVLMIALPAVMGWFMTGFQEVTLPFVGPR
ncbi:flagellar type III secretion system protein FliR [Pelagibius litoralis]|uniref:Flagellar biosynthetic protein FliR n=1 Tax=Pelagibius litoralis TaxID=374515 RepID=A0A967K8S3_9PROT|nr:flagellar biosynthetic protein FliR [Pelagibius litoralis]NIA69432.1 flagellar type III secretion system protein FliR [Pelagibius litoralis]